MSDIPARHVTQDLESVRDLVWFAPRDRLVSRVIAGVEGTWRAIAAGGRYPSRPQLDPLEFKPWLPYLSLMELHDDPLRVRYRLVGTETVRFGGEDYTGKWIDETNWTEDVRVANLALYRRLLDTAAPVYGFSVAEWHDRADCLFEWALLPLLDDSGRITQCLSVDDYSSIAPRTFLLRESGSA